MSIKIFLQTLGSDLDIKDYEQDKGYVFHGRPATKVVCTYAAVDGRRTMEWVVADDLKLNDEQKASLIVNSIRASKSKIIHDWEVEQ